MKLVFFGAPGVGKGTQAERLSEHLGVPHISTGDIFRRAISEGTELGRRVAQYVRTGTLVPDDLTNRLVAERLKEPDCSRGYILDGFPRTAAQALALNQADEKLDAVVYFSAADEVLVERLSGRRLCRECGAGFNVVTMPPKVAGVCDNCGGGLYQRDDDKPATVRHRLQVYKNETAELVDFYRREGLLREIPAEGAIEEVYGRLLDALEGQGA